MAIIEAGRFTIIHTEGASLLEDDTSFQKAAWTQEQKNRCLLNAYRACHGAGISAENRLAALGFNQNDRTVREIKEPDTELFTKRDGNVLIANSTEVTLIAWASDCCLVALIDDDGDYAAVLHASVNTFKNGIIDQAVKAMHDRGVKSMTAYVGICAGKCCYEYGAEKASEDFAEWPDFIVPSVMPGKVFLDLGGAVRESLRRNEVKVVDIFPNCACNICARKGDGAYRFFSYRRDRPNNGQYALLIHKR